MTITLKDPTGPYQMLLDSPGPFQPSRTHMDPPGPSWTLLHPNVPYRSNVTEKGLK